MSDSTKYLVHVDVAADGVVERSDVVGAIFGQTEGLLGDDMNLHDLQQSSKVGRIDVEIDSERGRSAGRITIASTMDKVETAVLAASLETIERIGPCRATLSVDRIEDVRAATRREVVERAEELLSTAFDDTVMSSEELLETVRERIRVGSIDEYDGYPAGPRVEDSDAIIVVEGRADVLNLLRYGIKNAVAVEGTDVPASIATLTKERTATAFLDGDRGGELILKELEQVGAIDAVAFAPPGRAVEELDRGEVMTALRRKVPLDGEADVRTPVEFADVDRERASADPTAAVADGDPPSAPPDGGSQAARAAVVRTGSNEGGPSDGDPSETGEPPDGAVPTGSSPPSAAATSAVPTDAVPSTLPDHVDAVIGEAAGEVRLLDSTFEIIDRGPVEDAFDLVAESEPVPHTIVVDGELTQRLLDVSAQRGVAQIVAGVLGDFTKQPIGVRIRTTDEFSVRAAE